MNAVAKPDFDFNQVNVVPHVCRHCLGRLVEKNQVFRCSGCGAMSPFRPKGICGCGIKVQGGKGERYHCGPNPSISLESPAEYVILFGDVPAVAVKA